MSNRISNAAFNQSISILSALLFSNLAFAQGVILKFDVGYGQANFETTVQNQAVVVPSGAALHLSFWDRFTVGVVGSSQAVSYQVSKINRTGEYSLIGGALGLLTQGDTRLHLLVEYFPIAEFFVESDLRTSVNSEVYRYITRTTYQGSGAVAARLGIGWKMSNGRNNTSQKVSSRIGIELSYFMQQFSKSEERVVIMRPSAAQIDETTKSSVDFSYSAASASITATVDMK